MAEEFVPKYDAQFVSPVVDNLVDLFKQWEASSLLWANGGTPDPDGVTKKTKVWRIAHWYNTLFPVTSVVARQTTPNEADDRGGLDNVHIIDVEVELDGTDADKNTRTVEKRIAALDMTLRTYGTKQTIFKGMSAKAGALRLEIGPHNFSYFGSEEVPAYKTKAFFTVTVSVIEPKHISGG